MPTKQSTAVSVNLYGSSDMERCVKIEASPGTKDYRSEFRRDYGRLIHSPAFRRLQGKTQLFPGAEIDFFRNRLTHSIEVAQIAKTIAMKLNAQCPQLKKSKPGQLIDYDLIEVAAIAHDIGHPPFGHNGEKALNECMKGMGGFEGNAQTLRILTRLEKRLERNSLYENAIHSDGKDMRIGLNLTYRSLASVLKYDHVIPLNSEGEEIEKGYYKSEAKLVNKIKEAVLKESGHHVKVGDFKTIECQIMDVADDIAYSTYDLEDTFKAEFLSPLRLLWRISKDGDSLDNVLRKVNKNLKKEGVSSIDKFDLLNEVHSLFSKVFETSNQSMLEQVKSYIEALDPDAIKAGFSDPKKSLYDIFQDFLETGAGMDLPILRAYEVSNRFAVDGYFRNSFTSSLVSSAIEGVVMEYNPKCPPLSKVGLDSKTRTRVEILKHLTYELTIMSSRLKVVENRGSDIVKEIFSVLSKPGGERLLPVDFRELHKNLESAEDKKRILCDFIACMTDRYALEFYRRLKEAGESIFKPI